MFESPAQDGDRYHQPKPPGWHLLQLRKQILKGAAEFTWKAEGVAIQAKLMLRKATSTEIPCGRTPSNPNCNGCATCPLPRLPSSDDWPFPCDTGNVSPRPHLPITTDYRAWYKLKLGSLDENLKPKGGSGRL